ncbi:MAG: tripartite tricarboxylate transporter substrate binding protein [Betaproteobacteria bacterium]|nr:tripartite tricarboxylate transporter substrate binding protein [Betaproteobacteria bacterium]NBY06438.1 tripartite tricarboxylate transporter substrate binding protein [Betaproteobacteria bacterium]
MTFHRRNLLALMSGLVALPQTWAQEYAQKTVRLISPYPPGGGNDTVCRLIADKLSTLLGQKVIVDNKPGGNTILANDIVAKSAADGYTLILNSNGFVINPNFYKKLPFDVSKDIAPVSLIGLTNLGIVAHPSLGVNSIQELLTLAKAKPGQLNFGTSGHGGVDHLAGVVFNQQAGINIAFIPYKGTALAQADLVGGQVQLMFSPLGTAQPFIASGRLRLLAVASANRVSQFPDVPTLAEAGVTGCETFLWYGLMAAAGTPEPIVRRLNDEMGKVLQMKDVLDKLLSMDIHPRGANLATPERFASFIKSELTRTSNIVQTAGIKAE